MSGPLGSHELMYATGSNFYEHQIASSTRFNGTGYLNDERSGDGSNSHGTISCWFKRAKLGAYQYIFSAHEDGNNAVRLTILDDDTLEFRGETAESVKFEIETTNVFRDTSAWYHVVGIIDMDNGTQADRAQVYINGERQTVLDTSTMPADASQTMVLNTGANLRIGAASDASYDFHGYITEFVVIDGTAQAVGDFGETKNGVWIPKDPSGLTFGTNGVYLKMADSSNLGTDSSGNGHTFALTNIDANDHTLDSPTFGGSSSGNFPLWSPLIKGNVNLSEGNTRMDGTTNERGAMTSWAISTGTKFYIECLVEHVTGKNILFGIANPDINIGSYFESDSSFNGILFRANNSSSWDTCSLTNGSRGSFGSNVGTTAGRVLAMTVNRVDNEIKMYLDNSLKHTISISATEEYHIVCNMGGGADSSLHMNINAGHDSTGAGDFSAGSATDGNGFGSFQHAPPSGFLALCSANLPTAESIDPAETDDNFPQKLFNAVLYTGNDGTQTVAMGFKPDMLMLNMRGNTGGGYPAQLWDTTRGDDYYMYPSGTAASVTSGTDYVEFVSTGFKTDESWDGINHNGEIYVAHGWRANGGTTSTNSSGDINTTVQVDPTGSFSIATWTGSGNSGETIGHGLSAAPSLTVIKQTGGGTNGWNIWASGNNSGDVDSFGEWNGTGAWNQNQGSNGTFTAAPTSTLLTLTAYGQVNASSKPYIGYFFADCDGYIKSGSYEGNGNADGTFVYTGFSPAYIWCKSVDSTSDWLVFDNERLGYNVDNNATTLNGTAAETTTDMIDILSNGFKCRIATDPNVAETYVYLAIAHNPFKYATAR